MAPFSGVTSPPPTYPLWSHSEWHSILLRLRPSPVDAERLCAAYSCCWLTYDQFRVSQLDAAAAALARPPPSRLYPKAANFKSTYTRADLHADGGVGGHLFGLFEDVSDPSDKHLYVAFMGSVVLANWVVDFTALSNYKAGGVGSVHAGFWERAQHIPIDSVVGRLRSGWRVTITGHSLGGAVAALVMRRLLSADPRAAPGWASSGRLRCITFAAPAVGCASFHSSSTALGYTSSYVHVVHEADIVPRAALHGPAAFRAVTT